MISPARFAATLAIFVAACGSQARASTPISVKVMIVSMFAPEGLVWRSHRDLGHVVRVPGLPANDPNVRCGSDGVCQMTTGMGYANAAASIAAVAYSQRFDLRRTYWLVAGIAGVDPHRATLGSAAWAHYVVDFGLQWEIDARDVPKRWSGGYLGIDTTSPAREPKPAYGTELFELDAALARRAFSLSQHVRLADDPAARRTRVRYAPGPARRAPDVVMCDTVSSDTWFSGRRLSARAAAWASLLTDGKSVACTSQQEDNATLTALARAASAGLVDIRRVAIVRTGSDFNEAPPGGSDVANLLAYRGQGGFAIAIENLYRAGDPLVREIAGHWTAWRDGLPPAQITSRTARSPARRRSRTAYNP